MKQNELNITKQTFHGIVDLFSGAGGMSFGFHKHPAFRVLAAADAEIGKPSMKAGTLRCNSTYALNMGIEPVQVDLGRIEPRQLRECLGIGDQHISVLSACAPCTGFSRANPQNHLRNDYRNTLVEQSGLFATALDVDILVMENARELLSGNFACHFQALKTHLEKHGYTVHAESHMLTRYGLPQIRERALVIAVKSHLPLKTLADLWDGCEVSSESLTVRKAFSAIRPDAENTTMYPKFADESVLNRLAAIPQDGGSWTDLILQPIKVALMTVAFIIRIDNIKMGWHTD
nr:DNA cytosine methyltransferase [Kiritimatiellia bacterium]